MTYRLAIANAQKTDNRRDNAATVAEIAAHADLAGINEADAEVHAAMHAQEGFEVWIPRGGAGANPVMWNPDKVAFKPLDTSMLMVGGRVGLSIVLPRRFRRDRRRLGPNRYATSGLATDIDGVLQLVPLVTISEDHAIAECSHLTTFWHGPARTQTSERWRWPVMVSTIRELRRHNAALERLFPGRPHVVLGDTNLRKVPRVFLGRWWREVKLPADLGRVHYTRIWVKNPRRPAPIRKLVLGQPRRFRTKSDHFGEVVNARFGGLA